MSALPFDRRRAGFPHLYLDGQNVEREKRAMNEQSIFLEALEKTTPQELTAWLDASCGGDGQLRERVEALLRRHHEASGFLEQPGRWT